MFLYNMYEMSVTSVTSVTVPQKRLNKAIFKVTKSYGYGYRLRMRAKKQLIFGKKCYKIEKKEWVWERQEYEKVE